MVNMSKRQQPHLDENASPNPNTTEQAAAGPKTSLYTGTAKELPLYTQITQKWNKRQTEARIFRLGTDAKIAAGFKYFGGISTKHS